MKLEVKAICIVRRIRATDIISIELEGPSNFPAMPENGCFLRAETVRGGAESWLAALGFDSSLITLVEE